MKNRIMKKIVATICMTCMVAGTLVGCGNNNSNQVDNSVEDKNNLKIMMYAKGYGSEWLQAIAEAFEKKHEGVNVDITLVTSNETMDSEIKNENSDTDLYFHIYEGAGRSLYENYKKSYKDGQVLRDLTYLMDTQIPGEEVTLGEKMNSSIKSTFKVDGYGTEDTADDTYFYLPYMAAPMGLYYNETVIDNALGKGNWEVPNTTNELIQLCERLKAKDCHILIPATLDQWTLSMYLSWWAQYEGFENFMKFYQGIGYNEQKGREEQNSPLIYQQKGRLESLKATYDLLAYDNGYILENTAEVTTTNLNEHQTKFTLAKNNYALYPCGDWLLTELESRGAVKADSVIKMMKTPVISSIIESVDGYSGDNTKRLPNVTSDEILSKVIDYVDGNGELPAGVTEEEVAVVKEARSMLGTRSDIHIAYAPEFSNAKALADEFLLFMASDEGIRILKETCVGGFAPYEYDYTELEGTAKSVYEVSKGATFLANFRIHELFYRGGVSGVTTAGANATIDGVFVTPNSITAEELNNNILKTYDGTTWQNVLKKLSQ